MSLPDDLLEHASQLTELDPRRPKQVNLRRAVSASYYALFHLLTGEAAALYVEDATLLARIKRTFAHREMKNVSVRFARNELPRLFGSPPLEQAIPGELQQVAETFVDLQEARHEADYNAAFFLSRADARDRVEQARQAFDNWHKVRSTDYARVYLACFVLWKWWDKESG